MNNFTDLTGKQFGKWIVLRRASNEGKNVRWLCECQCEKKTKKIVYGSSLKSGRSRSCGCLRESIRKESRKTNMYELFDTYSYVYATNTNKKYCFDTEDYDKVKDYTWQENSYGYLVTSFKSNGKIIHKSFHRIVMDVNDPEQIIDHIDQDKTNDCKSNLRLCNKSLNGMNKQPIKTNSSGITGVSYKKNIKKWVARIYINGKEKYLGCFGNKEDAIKARLKAEKELFGEFAGQRNLFEQYNI